MGQTVTIITNTATKKEDETTVVPDNSEDSMAGSIGISDTNEEEDQ